jgi:hypothetical protein
MPRTNRASGHADHSADRRQDNDRADNTPQNVQRTLGALRQNEHTIAYSQ